MRSKRPERIDLDRPGPVVGGKSRIRGGQPAAADQPLHVIDLDADGERAVIDSGAHAGTRQEPGRPAHGPAEFEGFGQPDQPGLVLPALEGRLGLCLETVVLEYGAAHGLADCMSGTEVLGPFRVIAPPEQGPREIDTTVRLDERRAGLDGHRQRTTRMLDRLVPVVALGCGIGLQWP